MFVNKGLAEKKYAVLPTNLIRLFGEICGYQDLDEQIYQILAEDATFRFNELLTQSENLRIKLNKEKLDVNDVNLMMKCQNIRPIYGYESSEKNSLKSVIDEREESIDLINETNKLLNNKHHVRLRLLKINSEYVHLKYENLNECIEYTNLPEQCKKYYYFIIKHLFNSNNELYKRILKDLSSNEKLGDLIYYLINHFNQTFHFISQDANNLMRLVFITESIMKNKHLDFKLQKSLISLIDLLLDCLLNDNLKFVFDFLIKFRCCSAEILGFFLIRFHYLIVNTQDKIIIKILNLLLNHFIETNHLDIKYGIMIFFQHLNPFIFFEILFSYLMEFIKKLEMKLINETIDPHEKHFFDSALDSLTSCFNYVINSNRILNSMEFNANYYYLEIADVYGDTFTNRIASNDANFIKIMQEKIE